MHEVDRKDLDNLFREQSVDNSVSKDVHSEDEAESNISIEKELENPLSLEKERSVESENVTNAESVSLDEFENVLSRDRQQLISDQQSDVNLKSLPLVEYMTKDSEGYFYKDGLLMHRFRPSQYNNLTTFYDRVVIPQSLRQEILRVAHSIPIARHMGVDRTRSHIEKHFYWPGFFSDIRTFCKVCPECQLVARKRNLRGLL